MLDPTIYAAALRDARDVIGDLALNGREEDRAAFTEALVVLDADEDVRVILETATRLLMRA